MLTADSQCDIGPEMRCEVKDRLIAEVVREGHAATSTLPIPVIKSLRAKLRLILAAPDMDTLRNWKSLRFREAESGGIIQISVDWVMRVEIVAVGGSQEMKITGITASAGATA